ncbi:hypothetical protein SPBR_04463 [Sporothrix brasiliensis 5110]|uniref:SRP9 domain-containing protein n=1 Tax=Sporothrix brasiliensis 5110 TaxID=1398154 RepID=A0A0C2FRS5_9PEZI|nr:uncharacterized protein SPBR_04463 [Sporothrix brasiliensis 5110]KIH93703.1 hypothetical protein SPBR_04463 [Sporothrix brasiliensis 5110]
MATFATSQQWLHQSSLLLEARPHTTKITCRYSVKPKPVRRVKKAKDGETLPDAPPATTNAVGQNPRAKLVLKTVDPASGVCLKYETTKAAEVSRLVQLLGQLSRRQAGLVAGTASAEEQADDVAMAEAAAAAAATPADESGAAPSPAPTPAPAQQQQGGGGGGGGKGKKKKGKR